MKKQQPAHKHSTQQATYDDKLDAEGSQTDAWNSDTASCCEVKKSAGLQPADAIVMAVWLQPADAIVISAGLQPADAIVISAGLQPADAIVMAREVIRHCKNMH